MAKWQDSASSQFKQLQQATNATDAQMDDLRRRIATWADQNQDGRQTFAFTPLRMNDAAVGASTSGGWIVSIAYGDRVG